MRVPVFLQCRDERSTIYLVNAQAQLRERQAEDMKPPGSIPMSRETVRTQGAMCGASGMSGDISQPLLADAPSLLS